MPEALYALLAKSAHKEALRLYRIQNSIWMWLGGAAVVSCIAWFFDPEKAAQKSAIGRQLGTPIDDVWNVVWAIGGFLIVVGVWNFRPRLEFVGHIAVCAALATYSMSVVFEIGLVVQAFVIGGIAMASAFRAYFLWAVTPKVGDEE